MPNLAQEQKESRPDTVLRLRTPSSDHFQEIRDPGIRAIDILSNRSTPHNQYAAQEDEESLPDTSSPNS